MRRFSSTRLTRDSMCSCLGKHPQVRVCAENISLADPITDGSADPVFSRYADNSGHRQLSISAKFGDLARTIEPELLVQTGAASPICSVLCGFWPIRLKAASFHPSPARADCNPRYGPAPSNNRGLFEMAIIQSKAPHEKIRSTCGWVLPVTSSAI